MKTANEIFAENLQRFLYQTGKTDADVCVDLNVAPSTFSEWRNGKKYPRSGNMQMLAEYFGVEMPDMVEEYKPQVRKKKTQIPVLGSVPAGAPAKAVEDIIEYIDAPEDHKDIENLFGLRVKGKSMEPLFLEGDTVVIRCQSAAENDNIVVAMINGEEATIKRFRQDKNGITLIPNNPVYNPLYFTNQQIADLPVRIMGRVVELRRKF